MTWRVALLLVLLFGAGAAPAAEFGGQPIAELEARLAAEPDNLALRFAYARALSWDERWRDALAEYDRLLEVVPDDPDYLLGKAQVLAWSGRPAEALPLLEAAHQRAPGYEAVVQLKAQVQAQLASPASRHIEAGIGWQDLSRGLADWRTQYVEYARRDPAGRLLFGGVRRTERFGLADHEARLGGVLPLAEDWHVSLEATLAPAADVLPRRSGQARVGHELGQGWGVAAGLRRAHYANDELTVVTLGAERYLEAWYAGWTVSAGRLAGADTTWSNQLRIDRYYGEFARVGLILSAGRETDSLGDGRFTTDSTRTIALLGMHPLGPSWLLSWELLLHEQGDAYTRRGLRAGLRHQF